MRSCVLDAIPECTSNNTTNNYSSDEGLWQRPKRQSKNNWLFRWIFNTTNPINLFNYILWHPFHSCIIFDPQWCICAQNSNSVAASVPQIWREFEMMILCPWPWPFEPKISSPRQTVQSFKLFRSGVFVLLCLHTDPHTSTHIHTMTKWSQYPRRRRTTTAQITKPLTCVHAVSTKYKATLKICSPGDKETANWKTCRCIWDRSHCA